MRRLAALAFLLVACSAQPPVSASATPSPSTCRLAVISGSPGQGAGPQTPGFLTLPGLTFSPDPGAGDGMYYDKQLARWVPWGPPALSSDGATYAYVEGDQTRSRVHLVDVRTKRDTQLAEGGPWRLVGLASEAIYLMRIEYVDTAAYGLMAFGRGLWKLPLTGGVAEQLTSDSRSWTLGAGAAWGGGSTMDDAGGPNDIVRLDLKTKQSTTWFAHGTRSFVLAFDGVGAPLVMSEAADEELVAGALARWRDQDPVWSYRRASAVRPGRGRRWDGLVQQRQHDAHLDDLPLHGGGRPRGHGQLFGPPGERRRAVRMIPASFDA